MPGDQLSQSEQKALVNLRHRYFSLKEQFYDSIIPHYDSAENWYNFLARFKNELINFTNDLNMVSAVLAKEYLIAHFDITSFDTVVKAQGTSGFPIDIKTRSGERIVAVIKTIQPFKENDLDTQQIDTFKRDADKLRRANAKFKIFFVTDISTFDVLKKQIYQKYLWGIRIVHLPSGLEI